MMRDGGEKINSILSRSNTYGWAGILLKLPVFPLYEKLFHKLFFSIKLHNQHISKREIDYHLCSTSILTCMLLGGWATR